jgi:putative SOS response-associated peptidase YedK
MCGRFTRFHTWADIHRMYRLLPASEAGRNTEARYNIALASMPAMMSSTRCASAKPRLLRRL